MEWNQSLWSGINGYLQEIVKLSIIQNSIFMNILQKVIGLWIFIIYDSF